MFENKAKKGLFSVIFLLILLLLTFLACGGGGSGDGGEANDRTAEIVAEFHSDESLSRLDNENAPYFYRLAAMADYPELEELIGLGSDAVPGILEEFQRQPAYIDDTPLMLLAYALEEIGDPSAVPVLAQWLETNMFATLDWSQEFVTHTIKVLGNQEGRNDEYFTYGINEMFDTIAQATSSGATITPSATTVPTPTEAPMYRIRDSAGTPCRRQNCKMRIRVSGIDADGNADIFYLPFNTHTEDFDDIIAAASGEDRAQWERRKQDLQEADAFYDAPSSDYTVIDPSEDVSRLSNCGGEVSNRILNKLFLDKGIPFALSRGTSNAPDIAQLARLFGEEVDLAEADLLTVVSHEVGGISRHVEVPIEIDTEGDALVIFSKDNYGKRYTHTVPRHPTYGDDPYGPVVAKYGQRPWYDVVGTFETRYYRIDPNRITDISVDSSSCPCWDECGSPTLTVSISLAPSSPEENELILFSGEVSGGEGPYFYNWDFGDGGKSSLSSETHRYTTAGFYTVKLSVLDANEKCGIATVRLEVRDPLDMQDDDVVVYYFDNLGCWDAKRIEIGFRETFEKTEYICNFPGGGIDCSIEAEKVEMQGGFDTIGAAQEWLCPQFTAWYFHYWCTAHYVIGSTPYMLGAYLSGCDFSDLPQIETPE